MTDFEKIFEDNQELVFKYLLKLTHDSSLAEELTQDTFFRAYINLKSLRSPEKASLWLCSIAKNTYFAWYNEQKKLLPLEQDALLEETSPLEEQFLQKELSKKALRCLSALKEPYRTVFILSALEDCSLKELSTLYGKSESWARVTFYRAKQMLHEQMEE